MDYGNLKVPENVTPEVQAILDSYEARNKEIENAHRKNTGLPKANSKPDLKPNVDKYHYFTVNVKVGDEVIPVVLDAEQLIGESTIKPQTVHLYNFGEK